MTLDLAIVMGSSYTSVFQSGYGVVLREPTIAAFASESKKISAVGTAALSMVGKTPDKTTLIAPVRNGIITEQRVASQMLKEFITRLFPKSYIFRPKVKAIMAIPTGLNKVDCEAYYNVCYDAGISDVRMVPKILMSAVGIDLPVASPISSMIAALGGGTTEIAVIALSGILSSGAWGVTIGGDMMDRAICDYVAGKYNLKIGMTMAAKLKEETASLFQGDMSFKEVTGLDLNTKKPLTVKVYASDLKEVLSPYYLRVADIIETAVNGCGPETSCDISERGIFLTGGASKIPGLSAVLEEKLDLKINIAVEPEFAAIVGGGKLLKNKELLESIIG